MDVHLNYPLIAHRGITFRDPLEGDVQMLHPSSLRKGDEGRTKSRTLTLTDPLRARTRGLLASRLRSHNPERVDQRFDKVFHEEG